MCCKYLKIFTSTNKFDELHKFIITHSVHVLYNKKEKAKREKERERSQRESDLKMEKAERRSGKIQRKKREIS